MDTRLENPDIDFDLPEIVSALRSRLLEEFKTVTEKNDVILAKLEHLVEPEDVLEPTTKEECEKAAEKVTSAFSQVEWELRMEKDKLDAKIATQIRLLSKMVRVMDHHLTPELGAGERRRITVNRDEATKEIQQVVRLRREYETEVNVRKNVLLQSSLIRLVEKQDNETKVWFSKNNTYLARCAAHVTRSHWGTPRPIAFLQTPNLHVTDKRLGGRSTETPIGPIKRSDSGLPSELMTLVYSFSDLETCVNLREVNSGWFSAFRHLEPLLKEKMQKRNPWITPGDGDLITWTDCVLVFVARLKNPKWVPFTCATEIKPLEDNNPPCQRLEVVASELKFRELLPANFQNLVGDGECASSACRHFHASTSSLYEEEVDFEKNMWTGKTVDSKTAFKERPDLCNENEYVVQYYDDLITFPSRLSEIRFFEEDENDDEPCIVSFPSYIVAYIGDERWIFPRDRPHYNHVTIFDNEQLIEVVEEVQGILIAVWVSKDREWCLLHVETKQLLPMTWMRDIKSETPTASYNGLLWWRISDQLLLPTFVDLKEPEKAYYRGDRAISGVSRDVCTQGERSRDLGRYFVGRSNVKSMIEVVDLETRKITTVYSPHYWTSHVLQRMFLGFVEGQFQARCMHPDTVDGTTEEILHEWEEQQFEESDDEEEESDEEDW